MANGKIERIKDIFVGCKLTLNNHSFQIDLMPIMINSFDVIVGMYCLSPHHPKMMCYEKVVCLNLPNNENLIIYGHKPEMNLQIISCIKA